jgi:hypothetical protein
VKKDLFWLMVSEFSPWSLDSADARPLVKNNIMAIGSIGGREV